MRSCLLLLLLVPGLAFGQDLPPADAPQPVIEQAAEVLAQPATQQARDLAAEVRAGEQSDAKIAAAVTARFLRHPRLQQAQSGLAQTQSCERIGRMKVSANFSFHGRFFQIS